MGGERLELVRSGGFAGVTRRWELDLGAEEAAELERLFDGVVEQPARGADRFQYELRLTRDGRTRALTLHEGAIPPDIRPVIDRLMQ